MSIIHIQTIFLYSGSTELRTEGGTRASPNSELQNIQKWTYSPKFELQTPNTYWISHLSEFQEINYAEIVEIFAVERFSQVVLIDEMDSFI